MKISLDGSIAEKHDFYRGRGSYDKTIKAIELLDKFNMDISLAMVITKNNFSDVPAMTQK